MAKQWPQRNAAPKTDGQELWAKDRVMASMNGLTAAVAAVQLEVELARQVGEPAFGGRTDADAAVDRMLQLHELFRDLHLKGVGADVQTAVATVTQAFPNAEAAPAQPAAPANYGSGPGDVVVDFGKHEGHTIARVYAEDPTYIRNYLVEKARDAGMRDACRAFLAQVDGKDPYA